MMSLLIFNNLSGNGIKLVDNAINEFEFATSDGQWKTETWTHVIWDARRATNPAICDARSSEALDEIKETLETFCLLRRLDVIDTTHDLREWVESLGGTLHMVSRATTVVTIPGFAEEEPVHEWPKPLVVSNVCWGTGANASGAGASGAGASASGANASASADDEMLPFLKDLGITDINVALSVYPGSPNPKLLRKRFDEAGMTVASLNAVYYTLPDVSIFNSFEKYVLHFKKYIHYAWILGAARIIYGSSSSKCVHTSKKTEYEYYKYAYELFSSTLRQIGLIAAEYKIKIHLKANARGNFIFEDAHAQDMCGLIDCPNVVSAPSRPPGPIINYGEFTLIEFPPTTPAKARAYIEHCVKTMI